ncbi:hypothetical protein A2U01_0075767, partial [Trifolium medium]|nr:hypothetical protein [Trifolium medium]
MRNKDEVEARELAETMTQNEYRALNDKGAKKKVGTIELETQSTLLSNSKLMNVHLETLIKHLTTTN